MSKPDFEFNNHGSIWVCTPMTGEAKWHLNIYVQSNAQTWGKGVVVEPRYVEQLAQTLNGNGFSTNLDGGTE